ncbi:MAG: serine/threonine protein kinase [uncultured Lysobacter sp.]|uniref:Serine/threonine protein kinase n=1 Tax=uncultured Lysobacter sp. TaxID=271060 RepID=A0A6J4LCI3_9GAMM|nr:MAG: serine/threonine protein kinase [uncultured Lysobacter sp.]
MNKLVPLLVIALAACSAQPPAAPETGAASAPTAGEGAAPSATPATGEAPASAATGPDTPGASPVLAPDPLAGDEPLARANGYGNLSIGMTVEEARKAWGGDLVGDEVLPDNCAYLRPVWAKTGAEFGLMFEGGRFVRYDIGHDRELAPGGGKVGMTRAQIEALYPGRVTAQPHEYVKGAHYLRVPSPGAAGILVFETDAQGRVTRWRAGQAPQVDYVEGCS